MKNKSQFLQTAQNATEEQFAQAPVYVEDFSGFNFLPNPFRENTHIFTCLSGEFICESPEEGDRFKYSRVVRPASDEEVAFYNRNVGNTINLEDDGIDNVYATEDCFVSNAFYCDDHNECAVCGSKWL